MNAIRMSATPWWVNLTALAPLLAWFAWRRGLRISGTQLFYTALYATSFGFVEGAVVVYLRAAASLLPAFQGTLADVQRQSTDLNSQLQLLRNFPSSLLKVEIYREAATLLMHAGVALAVVRGTRERVAMFLWCFAWWDICYYAALWATIRWPQSLTAPDILFLIPVPWLAQVWFPIAVSALMLAVVIARRRSVYED